MSYQLTSSKEIIARIDNDFDIDYSDWITRAPLWILDALSEMKMISSYVEVALPIKVEDYSFELPKNSPQDIKRILGVEYNNQLLIRLNVLNPIRQPKIDRHYSSETYSIKNGFITTSFEEGNCILYYDTLPVEYDKIRQVYYPQVPNDPIVHTAIEWYLIYCILRKGHKHPTYSLDSSNPITNPFLMWDKYRRKAINSVSAMDPEQRFEMMQTLTTFIVNLNNRNSESYIANNTIASTFINPNSINSNM